MTDAGQHLRAVRLSCQRTTIADRDGGVVAIGWVLWDDRHRAMLSTWGVMSARVRSHL
ncbi:MAG: hypothetical protein QGG26_14195 [Candidatus Undinarchaeales archaeon]|nr:hypothetical protein [Candidatus Undinarchaeales archaeon]